MRKFLPGLCAGLSLGGLAVAQDARRPVVAPFYCPPVTSVVPCPPVGPPTSPGLPIQPGMPGTPDLTGQTPVTPGGQTPTLPVDTPSQFAGQTPGGAGAPVSFNENTFGDLLGARAVRIGYRATLNATFATAGTTTLGDGTSGVIISPNPSGVLTFTDSTGRNSGPIRVSGFAGGTSLDYVQAVGAGGGLDTFYAQQALQTLLSTGKLTAGQIAQFNRLTPAQRAQILANQSQINAGIRSALNGLTVPNVTVTGVSGSVGNGQVNYTATFASDTLVALPGSSSGVGRVKMFEDNNPMPRDRVIFTYDSFGDVPFTSDGIGVNRFQFGVEKTFLDGLWSAEVRLPFAGTLAATNVQGAEVTGVELGNLRFALKRLWMRTGVLNVSSGVAVTLPTAADQVVNSLPYLDTTTNTLRSVELYRIRNRSVTVEPYVAALLTPNDRLFAQGWAGVNFDASGGDLTWNTQVFGGSGAGRFWDLPILSLDGQVGYWLVRNPCGTVRGLAPFVELHWNRTLGQGQLFNALGNAMDDRGLTVQGIGNQELNLTAGLLMQVGNNLNVAVGAAAPLLQQPDRTFNWQIGVRLNYLFGRTARDPSMASRVSGF